MASSYARYPSLAGKSIIITGGASGIGRACVEHFHAQGARVAFLDRAVEAGHVLFDRLTGERDNDLKFLPCDVTDTKELQDVIAAIGSQQGLNTLIVNAADDTRHATEDLTPQAWDACMAINLKHHFFAAQAAAPHIRQAGGGTIILMGSISWLNNTIGMVGYTTAKAAIHGLMRTLARQLGPHKIRVNILMPGWTMTERQMELWVDANAEAEIDRAQCLPGRVLPGDIARMALFLASDDAAMCTQQSFVVDGGWI